MATTVYSGTLQPKKKAELREIAVALHISDAGTREEIQLRIRKHLEENQTTLEDDPRFSGLFHKRRRAVPPSTHVNVPASPGSEGTEEISEKKLVTPPSRVTRRNFLPESSPIPEAREVSLMLKKTPISPPEEELPSQPPAYTPQKERDLLITSTPRSILRSIPRPTFELADTTFRTIQTEARQHARVYLLASRYTLSNSLNILLITALFELMYVLYRVIPWKIFVVHLPQVVSTDNWQFLIPYPPFATFQSYAFWSVLFHWSIPTLIIPAIFGSVISFHPANASVARVPRVLPFDPLTASILRLAAQYGYPYEALNSRIDGIDIIGSQWRILNAAVCVAFAFAEAIFIAPSAFADFRARQRAGTPRRAVVVEE